jgi:hypothetical protein
MDKTLAWNRQIHQRTGRQYIIWQAARRRYPKAEFCSVRIPPAALACSYTVRRFAWCAILTAKRDSAGLVCTCRRQRQCCWRNLCRYLTGQQPATSLLHLCRLGYWLLPHISSLLKPKETCFSVGVV